MAPTITIDVDEYANIRIEGHDIAGPDCAKLTAALESALGEVTKAVKKPEYHRAAVVGRKVGR